VQAIESTLPDLCQAKAGCSEPAPISDLIAQAHVDSGRKEKRALLAKSPLYLAEWAGLFLLSVKTVKNQ